LTLLPDLSTLLIEGTDRRLHLDDQGRNAYCCRPVAEPDLLRFGSSTATTISPEQWDQAVAIHDTMCASLSNRSIGEMLEQQRVMVVASLREQCRLAVDVHIQLADSGTDAHRMLMQQFDRDVPDATWRVILIDAAETGRGVPEALSVHARVQCEAVAIRDASGQLLPAVQVEKALTRAVHTALGDDKQVLLVLVDGSKTGVVAPTLDTALALRRSYPDHVRLLVDGCQFRFSIERLNRYLQHGIPVAITGSKFLAAPSFCAALLLPGQQQVPQAGIGAGLLLRWQLALYNLQQLNALPKQQLADFMADFSSAMQQQMERDDALTPLVPPRIRPTPDQPLQWHDYPTIYPFMLHHGAGVVRYRHALQLFASLQQDKLQPIQLGRPMPLGSDADPAAIFRLAVSAPMLVDAINQRHERQLIEQALAVFRKVGRDMLSN